MKHRTLTIALARAGLAAAALGVACTAPTRLGPSADPRGSTPDTTPAATTLPTLSDTSHTGGADTGDTGTVELVYGLYPDQVYDCTAGVPSGPYTKTRLAGVVTTEDFTFDTDGYMVAAGGLGDVVVRYARDGTVTPVAPSMASRGFDILPDGGVVISDPNFGTLTRLDLVTGALTVVGTAPWGAAAVAVSADAHVYTVSHTGGEVSDTDTYTGNTRVLSEPATQLYGVALSPDEQTLYIASYNPTTPGVFMSERVGNDWTDPVLYGELNGLLGGMAADICGNVYVVAPTTCLVSRIALDGTIDVIGDAGGPSDFCASVEFGSGLGGWEATSLFVSTYHDVVAFDVGVPGRDR